MPIPSGTGGGAGSSRRASRRAARKNPAAPAAVPGSMPPSMTQAAFSEASGAVPKTAADSSTAGRGRRSASQKRSRRSARKAARKAGLPSSEFRAATTSALPTTGTEDMVMFKGKTQRQQEEEAVRDVRRMKELIKIDPSTLSPAERVKRQMELLTFGDIGVPTLDEQDPYDPISRFAGRGRETKQGILFLPYLQSGHLLLLGILLLCSLIDYPGFPLTQVPEVYREQILKGIGFTYLINLGCAFYSGGIARRKEEPVGFWFGKILLFGGISLGELTLAVPDAKKWVRKNQKKKQKEAEAAGY
mmetsp:Transcript_143433/g.267331  ORF Transcript_143433/g.267331 Transcript_143433/m.267331 type:complete len:303 (-) Transcript_143433:91-999(-)